MAAERDGELSRRQAEAAADALLEPELADQQDAQRTAAGHRERPWFVGVLTRHGVGGRWTVVCALGGFTVGLLVGTWLRSPALPAAGVGAGVGAIVGCYFDRKLSGSAFVVVVTAVVAVAYGVSVLV